MPKFVNPNILNQEKKITMRLNKAAAEDLREIIRMTGFNASFAIRYALKVTRDRETGKEVLQKRAKKYVRSRESALDNMIKEEDPILISESKEKEKDGMPFETFCLMTDETLTETLKNFGFISEPEMESDSTFSGPVIHIKYKQVLTLEGRRGLWSIVKDRTGDPVSNSTAGFKEEIVFQNLDLDMQELYDALKAKKLL